MHTNKTFTKERLDWVLANQEWIEHFESISIEILQSSRSDHLPLLMSVRENKCIKGGKNTDCIALKLNGSMTMKGQI